MIIETTAPIQNCPRCGAPAVIRSNADPNYPTPLAGIKFWGKCENRACGHTVIAVPTLDEAIAEWGRAHE